MAQLAITLPASADTIFNLNNPTGDLGSQTPDLLGVNNPSDPSASGVGLTGKSDGEIQTYNYVQIDFADPKSKGATGAKFEMGSVQSSPQEGWAVCGSNTLGQIGTSLLTGATDHVFTSVPSAAFSQYRYFSVTATAYDVFLNAVCVQGGTTGVPEPATFLLAGIALVGLGASKYRNRKSR